MGLFQQEIGPFCVKKKLLFLSILVSIVLNLFLLPPKSDW